VAMVFYNFILVSGLLLFIKADPYYPLGPIGTVPRPTTCLGSSKEWKGDKAKINK
jgi:hypothetical protein